MKTLTNNIWDNFTKIKYGFSIKNDYISDSHSENLKRFATKLDFHGNIAYVNQIHSTNLVNITGPNVLPVNEDADALMTTKKDIMLAVKTADCVPILFYNPKANVIAAVHSGWRGTASKIALKTLDSMYKTYNAEPKATYALLGPSIASCCYEVGEDLIQKFKYIDLAFSTRRNKIYFDLKLVIKTDLLSFGIKDIQDLEQCTSCEKDLFHSYRRDNNQKRNYAVIVLKT